MEGGGKAVRVEARLKEFGDDAASSDEVDHADGEVVVLVEIVGGPDLGGVFDEMFGEGEGDGRYAVDDDERVADDGGLYCGGAAGDDRGAGVMEGFAGVGDEVNVRERGGDGCGGDPAFDEFLEARAVDGGGDGEDVLAGEGKAAGHLDHGGEVGGDLLPATAGKERDPGLFGIEFVMRGVGLARDGW